MTDLRLSIFYFQQHCRKHGMNPDSTYILDTLVKFDKGEPIIKVPPIKK
jgi:hypothetical protein